MNRTNEFYVYFNGSSGTQSMDKSRSFNNIANQQRNPRSDPYMDLASKIQKKLSVIQGNLNDLKTLVDRRNIMGQNDVEVNQKVEFLKNEIPNVLVEIERMSGIKSAGTSSPFIIEGLKQKISNISSELDSIVKQRAERSYQISARRGGIGDSYQFNTPTTYGSDQINTTYLDTTQLLNEDELNDRYKSALSIQSAITSIAGLMSTLTVKIAEADYDIIRIDQNTYSALEDMERGKSELEKYKKKIMTHKSLIIKIFIILFIFTLIFILIV